MEEPPLPLVGGKIIIDIIAPEQNQKPYQSKLTGPLSVSDRSDHTKSGAEIAEGTDLV